MIGLWVGVAFYAGIGLVLMVWYAKQIKFWLGLVMPIIRYQVAEDVSETIFESVLAILLVGLWLFCWPCMAVQMEKLK